MTLTEIKEYKYMATIPFTKVKKGMIVLEQDTPTNRDSNSISYFCRIEDCYPSEEVLSGFNEGWTLDLTALSPNGDKLFDWETDYHFEHEEDASIEIYFKSKEDASRFGIDPNTLEEANYDEIFIGDYEDAELA